MTEQMNKRKTGGYYEDMAAAFLENNGLIILERNFRSRSGEIDLIARDREYLVFVEVKYRSTRHQGYAVSAVDRKKQQRIARAARYYLLKAVGRDDIPCRFDVIGIEGTSIQWIQNAFEA